MGKPLTYLVASLLFAVNAAPALAQSEFSKDTLTKFARRVGIHANVGVMTPTDQDVTKGLTTGVSVGLSPGESNGWKFPFGISSYSEELNGPTGDQIGTVSMRPILAGVGYGHHFGKTSTSLTLQGGYSLNKSTGAGVSVDNSFIIRPRAQVEHFLTRKLTVRSTLSYIITDPKVVVTRGDERISGAWKGNALNASVGMGFYPFRR